MPKEYQIHAVSELDKTCGLKGKRVLEIGGDKQLEVANLMLAKGAAHVTSINYGYDFSDREVNEKLSIRNLDATKLASKFSQETFDTAFGVALLEHVHDLPLMLDQLYEVLKVGATAILKGNPIWTSAIGHHVWVYGDAKLYRFNNPEDNPIPNWHHLLLSHDELVSHLIHQESVNAKDASAIGEYVYKSRHLARTSHSEILDAFQNSRFEIVKIKEVPGPQPSQELVEKLNQTRWGSEIKPGIVGLEFVVRKPLN